MDEQTDTLTNGETFGQTDTWDKHIDRQQCRQTKEVSVNMEYWLNVLLIFKN